MSIICQNTIGSTLLIVRQIVEKALNNGKKPSKLVATLQDGQNVVGKVKEPTEFVDSFFFW